MGAREGYGRGSQRVDLPRVVSKYIGETEQNLARVLEHAEWAGAIFFFDEVFSPAHAPPNPAAPRANSR